MEYPSLDKPKAGATRFNTDTSQLEIYDGNQWTGILATSPEQQTGGTRGLFAGGRESAPAFTAKIEYANVDSTGDATNFGDLVAARAWGGGTSNSSRGIFFGNTAPTFTNAVEYITIATTGNAADWGDAIYAPQEMGGTSDSDGGIA